MAYLTSHDPYRPPPIKIDLAIVLAIANGRGDEAGAVGGTPW